MRLKHLFLILLLFSFIGCTSNKEEDDELGSLDESAQALGEDTFDDEMSDEFPDDPLDEEGADLDNPDMAGVDDVEGDDFGNDEFGGDELDGDLEGDDLGDVSADEGMGDDGDFADGSEVGLDDGYEEVDGTDSGSEFVDAGESVRTFIPVKKIKTVPYDKASHLVNAVYIVRDGDILASISSKIYGTPDRESELLEINPNLANKISVGDKVYYNSPNRPQDRARLLFYYEDSNLPANVYAAKQGENIRDIAESILGNRDSWKELWAHNMSLEESEKWTLSTDREITYWTPEAIGTPPASNTMADAPPPGPPSDMMGDMPIPPPGPPSDMMGDMPVPPPGPPSDMMGDMPIPPPGPPSDMMGDMPIPPPPPDIGTPPPPPPPDIGTPPPPPPPSPPALAGNDKDDDSTASGGLLSKLPGGGDKVTLLAIGVMLITLVLLIAIRKRAKSRQRASANSPDGLETQI